MGQLWNALSTEEKFVYQQQAAHERERIAQALAAWKAAGGVLELDTNYPKDGNLVFPLARIRKICKLDPDVRGLSKEALMLVTKCAELATAKLGQECVRVAQLQNRRKLLPDDVAHVCANREQFLFLKEDVRDLVKSCAVAADTTQKAGAPKKGDAAREVAAAGSKPLTSYFASSNTTNSKPSS
jgi:DNA-directed RNA polymerase I subunit RPA43